MFGSKVNFKIERDNFEDLEGPFIRSFLYQYFEMEVLVQFSKMDEY